MKSGRLLCIGKIRAPYWQAACQHYLKQLGRWRSMEIVELKDSNPDLPITGRLAQEADAILAKISPKDLNIALTETGQSFTSSQFAAMLRKCDETLVKRPAFIIGGPYGLDQRVISACGLTFSLSPLTFTHELARTLLLEQLYRGESILAGSPYHH